MFQCNKSVIIFRLTSDQHYDYCKDFLSVSIGRHISEAHGCKAAKGEIKRRDIATLEKLHCYHGAKGDAINISDLK